MFFYVHLSKLNDAQSVPSLEKADRGGLIDLNFSLEPERRGGYVRTPGVPHQYLDRNRLVVNQGCNKSVY